MTEWRASLIRNVGVIGGGLGSLRQCPASAVPEIGALVDGSEIDGAVPEPGWRVQGSRPGLFQLGHPSLPIALGHLARVAAANNMSRVSRGVVVARAITTPCAAAVATCCYWLAHLMAG